MGLHDHQAGTKNLKIRIAPPRIQNTTDETLWKEVQRFARIVPSEPEPNLGRVQEIKEEIRKGTYLTNEKIEETAARLAIRFLRRE